MTDLSLPEKMRVYAATGTSWTLTPASMSALARLIDATERKSRSADNLAACAERMAAKARRLRNAAIAYAISGAICFALALLIGGAA